MDMINAFGIGLAGMFGIIIIGIEIQKYLERKSSS